MAKLTDIQIRAWIKAGERFEGRSDGNGLYLRYRAGDKVPAWRFRYKFSGKKRVMQIGSYGELSFHRNDTPDLMQLKVFRTSLREVRAQARTENAGTGVSETVI